MAEIKLFHAVKNKTPFVGDGTVGDLVDWLKKFVDILFPENAIEYWSDNNYGGSNDLKRFQKVPEGNSKNEDIHHVACYVMRGGCEGFRINVGLMLRDETMKSLTSIKMFGSEGDAWLIARSISTVLDSICFYHELPEIVEMADKIPRRHSWHRETSLTEAVLIAATSNSLSVVTSCGLVLDHRDWADMGDNAKYYVASRVADWKIALTNMKVGYTESPERRVFIDDLPGYTLSNRGVEGIEGLYVLPPCGNPLDDRDYLGYFKTDAEATSAARAHHASLLPA